jgi:hypothetical protein
MDPDHLNQAFRMVCSWTPIALEETIPHTHQIIIGITETPKGPRLSRRLELRTIPSPPSREKEGGK